MGIVPKHMRRSFLLGVLLAGALVGATADVAAALDIGKNAPDFELQSTMGGKIRLSDFAGKKNVLLEFYVADFGPT